MRQARHVGIAFAAALVVGCGGTADPTQQVRELLSGAEHAAEQRDGGYFANLLAESYRDDHGNDRDEMLRLIRGYFLTHTKVELVSHIDSVELEGTDAARAVLHAGVLGRRAGESLLGGLEGELYRVELELVEDDGTWHVIGASWRRAGD